MAPVTMDDMAGYRAVAAWPLPGMMFIGYQASDGLVVVTDEGKVGCSLMRKIQMAVLALFAVVALGSVYAQAASAVEWLLNGNAIAAKTAATTEGESNLIEMKSGTELLCNGSFVGTVGPAAAGEITEVVGLAGEKITKANELNATTGFLKCTFTKATPCESGMAPEVFPINLPWKTELLLITNSKGVEEIVNSITSGSGGNPGYEDTCLTLGVAAVVTCTNNTAALLENGASDVLAEFDSSDALVTPAAVCAGPLGTGEGLLQSTGGLTSVGGGTLSVSGE